MLGSGSRTSFIGPSPTSPRPRSTAGWPIATSPTAPTHATRPKPFKRFSLPAPAPKPIPVLPYTQAEWRKTIAEVKRKYFGKRYRACSARCVEVLDGIKDTSQVEPVYLIYLHFYAATSMEICARPLPLASPARANLLQQARAHFDKASILINAAEDSVLRKFRPGSVASSRGSSCHSPSGSVSSRAWTTDTLMSSPTESECSFDDLAAPKSPRQPPAKRVKKVSFSLPKDTLLTITTTTTTTAEPFIRPDSPTLGGFDDIFFHPSPPPQKDLPDLPFNSHSAADLELPLQLQTIPESDPSSSEEEDTPSPYLATARSVDRCCEHLASLRAHLARHAIPANHMLLTPPDICVSPPSDSPSLPRPLSLSAAAETEETRAARIERLRQGGWRRKRFDASRYEVLCQAVLAELE